MSFTTGYGRYAIGPGRLFVDLVEQSVSALFDQELDVVFGDSHAHFLARRVHLDPTPLGMLTGRMDTVLVELEQVRWEHGRLDELLLRARNVHVAPGLRPAMVATPIQVTARLRQDTLDEWLAKVNVEWKVRLAGEGYVEVRWPGREHWGHAVFTAEVRRNVLRLLPEELVVRGRRVRGPVQRYAKPVEYPVPPLPGGTRVLGVEPHEDVLEVHGVVDEIREPVTVAQLQQMRKAVRRLTGPQLVLPRARR